MSLNPLALLEKAINEHGSAVILKERLELVKEALAKAEKEKSLLEIALGKANEEIAELKKQIPSSKFVEYRGAKFKRKPSGGYENSIYCPSCEVGMGSLDGDMPFVCGKCHSLTSFNSKELNLVLNEVSKEFP
ncbi:hypothetical protein [Shewanella xiamenensis]|uniref:hypothetical protein n=1 Tax=Shewanella xiamenensis TaxID=332186 RepID=UPI00313E6C46